MPYHRLIPSSSPLPHTIHPPSLATLLDPHLAGSAETLRTHSQRENQDPKRVRAAAIGIGSAAQRSAARRSVVVVVMVVAVVVGEWWRRRW